MNGGLEEGRRMDESETPKVAIAYDWHLPSPDWAEYDIALTLARADSGSRRGEPTVTTYHSKLPPAPAPADGSDVSGTLGLIDPVPDEYPNRPRASSAERLLADTVIWELAQLRFGQTSPHTVLLQGPLIPKLRGRLLYRGVAENSSIWSVTWAPEWTRRIADFCGAEKYLQPDSGISNVLPPEVLDRSTRAWFKNGMHWELLTDPWDCLKADVLNSHRKEIADTLPPLLSNAHQAAADRTKIERMFTELYPQCKKVDKSEPVRAVMAIVDRGMEPTARPTTQQARVRRSNRLRPVPVARELFAATEPLNWNNPAAVYKAFVLQQPQLLKG